MLYKKYEKNNWCLYRHLCILPERFGKKDRLVRCIEKDVTSCHSITSQRYITDVILQNDIAGLSDIVCSTDTGGL